MAPQAPLSFLAQRPGAVDLIVACRQLPEPLRALPQLGQSLRCAAPELRRNFDRLHFSVGTAQVGDSAIDLHLRASYQLLQAPEGLQLGHLVLAELSTFRPLLQVYQVPLEYPVGPELLQT